MCHVPACAGRPGSRAGCGARCAGSGTDTAGSTETRKRRRIPTCCAYAHYHCVRTHLYPPVPGIRNP
eukprot:scaffold2741_cov134-Isochrysis_galbana.AAC.7